MTVAATVFALCIVVLGLAVLVAAQSVIAFARPRIRALGSLAIPVSVILRLGVGACFFFAGWVARWPDFVQWFGILVGLAAFGVLFVGRKRLERIVDRVELLPGWVLRVVGLALLGLGALLVIGLQP